MSCLARAVSAITLACFLGSSLTASVHAQSSETDLDVRWTDPQGVSRSVRVPHSMLARDCTPPPAPVVEGERTHLTVVLVRDQTSGRAHLVRTSEGYRLIGVQGLLQTLGSCEATPELLDAMSSARPAAEASGPWLAFLLVGGLVTIAILGVALSGRGVGPDASLGPPREDSHAHQESDVHA